MKQELCLTKSNTDIKMTSTKQLKSASPTKMKRYLLEILAGCKDFNTSGTNLKPLEQIEIS